MENRFLQRLAEKWAKPVSIEEFSCKLPSRHCDLIYGVPSYKGQRRSAVTR